MDIPMRRLIDVKLLPVNKRIAPSAERTRAGFRTQGCNTNIDRHAERKLPQDAADCDMCLVDSFFAVLYACTGVLHGV
uniref:Gnk2-homologous domain-containing protein n=1 Tax=Steinernema glaseri TaxID=37863 RepID=A0A1I7ZLH3_9BILA